MHLVGSYSGAEAQRLAFELPSFNGGWPEVADEAETILVYEKEPHEPGAHFYLLLAYDDGERNEVGRKQVEGRA